MKRKLRTIVLWLIDMLYINTLFIFLNRNVSLILWYHGICDDGFTLLQNYDERHIPKSLFRKQLKYLKKKGYLFVTMSELVNALKSGKNGKLVALTFDDGFRNVVENAYPIMKEMNAKGCLYLVSNLVGTEEVLWTDHIEGVVRSSKGAIEFTFKGKIINYILDTKESYNMTMKDIKTKLRTLPDRERRAHLEQFYGKEIENVSREFSMVSWEQVKELDRRILEIGSHTKTHPDCANLTVISDLQDEVMCSKSDIESKVGYNINNFCYPAGSYNTDVISEVRRAGYLSAVSIAPGFTKDDSELYELKRLPTNEDFALFKAVTSGSYFTIQNIRRNLIWGNTARIREGERLSYYGKAADLGYWDSNWKVSEDAFKDVIAGKIVPPLTMFSSYLPRKGRILEAGCGMGINVMALRMRGYDIEGVDFAENTVNAVKHLFPDLPIQIGDVAALDMPDGFYSAYISFGVVEHAHDGPDKILREAHRILSPGGIALFTVPHFHSLRRLKADLRLYRKPAGNDRFYQYAFTQQEFTAILARHGFTVLETSNIGPDYGLLMELPLMNLLVRLPIIGGMLWRGFNLLTTQQNRFGHVMVVVARRS